VGKHNAGAPFSLSTRELGRRPGSSRSVRITQGAPEGFGTDVIAIPEGDPIELDLLLEAAHEGVLVTGTARGRARGACVRCLDGVDLDLEAPLQELFVYPERETAARDAGDETEDERVLDGEILHLEPVVRDALVTALPFRPMCREDCPGLCPDCGARLAEDPDHRHEASDPRWSALQGLFEQGES
jgi:uncharacterized protein